MDDTQVLTIIGANLALILVMIGTTISLFLWSRSEARHDQQEVRNLIKSIQDEMKDFHTRLAIQDLEFKNRLLNIEERKKNG